QLDDVRAAVRFLKTSAKKYKIDPSKVGALGDSAGGHLVLLLGLMDGEPKGISSKVQAVVNYYGPTDFVTWTVEPIGEQMLKAGLKGKDSRALLKDLLGTMDRKDPIMLQVSPITHIDAKDPPVLTLHGTKDVLVPADQAKRLHAALKKAGVPERLELLEGAGHGWGGKLGERTDKVVVEFLNEHLKKGK